MQLFSNNFILYRNQLITPLLLLQITNHYSSLENLYSEGLWITLIRQCKIVLITVYFQINM